MHEVPYTVACESHQMIFIEDIQFPNVGYFPSCMMLCDLMTAMGLVPTIHQAGHKPSMLHSAE